MIEIDPTVLQLLVATLIPLAVGIVTTKVAHSGVKAVVLAFLSSLAAVVAAALESRGLVTSQVVIDSFVNFVVAVATYYGVWKPTTVTEIIQDKTANLGITVKSET